MNDDDDDVPTFTLLLFLGLCMAVSYILTCHLFTPLYCHPIAFGYHLSTFKDYSLQIFFALSLALLLCL
jgi:hypothetical protein